jgi:hypothetical protein
LKAGECLVFNFCLLFNLNCNTFYCPILWVHYREFIKIFELDCKPLKILINSQNRLIILTQENGNSIYIYDLQTEKRIISLPKITLGKVCALTSDVQGNIYLADFKPSSSSYFIKRINNSDFNISIFASNFIKDFKSSEKVLEVIFKEFDKRKIDNISSIDVQWLQDIAWNTQMSCLIICLGTSRGIERPVFLELFSNTFGHKQLIIKELHLGINRLACSSDGEVYLSQDSTKPFYHTYLGRIKLYLR